MDNIPKVLNKKNLKPDQEGVYCGRGTPYGNPFIIPIHGNRDQVCDRFDNYIYDDDQIDLRELLRQELKGKNLICYCSPLRCHCDTLLKIANNI